MIINPTQSKSMRIILISLLAVLCTIAIESHIGLSLSDEGFLWYGVQRTVAGEVPIRDFASYEPGRYYWLASWSTLFDSTGIIVVRWGIYAFWLIGLATTLIFIAGANRNNTKAQTLYVLLAVCILSLWGVPRHKLFDISVAMLLTAGLAWNLQRPSATRALAGGFFLGLAFCFGRNHALYGALGYFLGLILAAHRLLGIPLIRFGAMGIMGFVLGVVPLVILSMLAEGFLSAYLDAVLAILKLGQTNLPLQVPWPWNVNFSELMPLEALRQLFIGILFTLILPLPLLAYMYLWGSRRLWKGKASPCFLAAVCMAIPYSHFAYSRADASHLSQGIPPFLIAILCLIHGIRRAQLVSLIALLGVSIIICRPMHPYFHCLPKNKCVVEDVVGDSLLLNRKTASAVKTLKNLYARHGSEYQTFLVAPLWPGAYALFNKRAPMSWTYPLFPLSKKTQLSEIERIREANPSFALIIDHPLDNRDELRFSKTNPLIFEYIETNFRFSKISEKPALFLYIPR